MEELTKVQEDEKKPWYGFVFILVAIGIDVSSIFLGEELATGLSISQGIIAIIVGSFILAIFAAISAYMAADTGLSTAQISRVTFGLIGSNIFSIFMVIFLLGWFVVQLGFLAENVGMFLNGMGISLPFEFLTIGIIGGILMIIVSANGYTGLEKLSYLSVPLLVLLILLGIARAISNSTPPIDGNLSTTLTISQGISFVIGIYIVGLVITPDIARYGKSPKQAAIGTFIGLLVGNSFMICVAFLLTKIPGFEGLRSFMGGGSLISIITIIIIVFAQWTTNNSNLFSVGTSLHYILKAKFSFKKIVYIIGGVNIIIFSLNVIDNFIDFLTLLSVFISPIIALYLSDYFFVNKYRYTKLEFEEINIPALIVWAISSLIIWIQTYGLGPISPINLSTIPAVDGIIFAGGLYPILKKRELKNSNI